MHEKLVAALRSHYGHLDSSTKPLVLSFHGTPGTGKNYVVDHIAKHLYKYGTNSNFIKKFMGRTDFQLESDVNYYGVSLIDSSSEIGIFVKISSNLLRFR